MSIWYVITDFQKYKGKIDFGDTQESEGKKKHTYVIHVMTDKQTQRQPYVYICTYIHTKTSNSDQIYTDKQSHK